MRKLLWFLTLIFLPFLSEAGSQVSGYISVQYKGGTTYQATIVDYTSGDPQNAIPCDGTYIDRDTLRIYWGDGNSELLSRSNGNIYPPDPYPGGDSVCQCRKVSLYTGTHTFPGPGTYRIYFNGSTRVEYIQNMSNSVNQDMVIYHTITINPLSGYDTSSPVIVNPPTCTYGCLSKCYNFNLGAYSPAGDSLSYSLGNCLGETSNYFIPSGVSVNPVTGEFSWCNPDSVGLWNFAILIVTYNKVIISGHPTQIPVDTEEVELQVTIDSACITAIPKITNANGGYTIYPNPSNGIFTLDASGVSSKSVVEVYNMFGELVFKQAINQKYTPIDLSADASGIYFYRLLNSDANVLEEGKIIVQR